MLKHWGWSAGVTFLSCQPTQLSLAFVAGAIFLVIQWLTHPAKTLINTDNTKLGLGKCRNIVGAFCIIFNTGRDIWISSWLNTMTRLSYICNTIGSWWPGDAKPYRQRPWHWGTRVLAAISQIPQCIRQIYHNAPFCNRKVHTCAHFCYKMVHCGLFVWCIMGFV